MKRIAFAIAFLACAALTPGVAGAAGLTFFPDRASFDAAEPGLPEQSFDAANLYGQPYVTQASPLTSATNDAVFAKGSILPGLKITTQRPGTVATALAVFAGGPVGSKSVGNNWFGDTFLLEFPKGVKAVGTNIFANTASGTSFAGKITVGIYSGTKYLGSKTFSEAIGGFMFLGVASATLPITRVAFTWDGDGDAITFVSDVAFGTPK